MGGQILAPFIMAPNTVGCLSVYIWYEFAEVGFPWRQLLPSFQARLRGHSLGGTEEVEPNCRASGAGPADGGGFPGWETWSHSRPAWADSGFHRLTTPTPWRNASSLCGSLLVTPRPSERPLLGLGPMCRPPRGPGCATAVLTALCLSLKREPRSSGSSVSVHVGPWPLFLGPLVPNSPVSTPSKCEPTLQSPHPHLRRLRPLWGAHAPATPHLR
ncbi:bcl-2-related protein A1 isoform X2 [Pteropus medius]|uniref:bcl-2-related protein A1 isoform X2 n=1 Tax=Pteropus vampyrus TaxID=132908 RepID=UPI00196B061D|nr:bcl-2-related protein A1 isoform X2 [Pteropus giganteus]